MPTTKQPTIKSLQANIKVLKAAVQKRDAEIEVLKVREDELWDKYKSGVIDKAELQREVDIYKKGVKELQEVQVRLKNELSTIKSKWWYKILFK